MPQPYPAIITRAEAIAAGMGKPLIAAYLRRGRWVALPSRDLFTWRGLATPS